MHPAVFLVALLSTVGIAAFTVIRVTRLFTNRPQSLAVEVMERVEELERTMQSVRRELADTQERLDFTERLLSAARQERRIAE